MATTNDRQIKNLERILGRRHSEWEKDEDELRDELRAIIERLKDTNGLEDEANLFDELEHYAGEVERLVWRIRRERFSDIRAEEYHYAYCLTYEGIDIVKSLYGLYSKLLYNSTRNYDKDFRAINRYFGDLLARFFSIYANQPSDEANRNIDSLVAKWESVRQEILTLEMPEERKEKVAGLTAIKTDNNYGLPADISHMFKRNFTFIAALIGRLANMEEEKAAMAAEIKQHERKAKAAARKERLRKCLQELVETRIRSERKSDGGDEFLVKNKDQWRPVVELLIYHGFARDAYECIEMIGGMGLDVEEARTIAVESARKTFLTKPCPVADWAKRCKAGAKIDRYVAIGKDLEKLLKNHQLIDEE